PCKGVVRWIPQDHQNRRIAFDLVRRVAFLLQLRKQELDLWPFRRLPTGQGVGEVNARSFLLILGERGAQVLQQQAELQVGHDKRRGQNLEAEDALAGGPLEVVGQEG